MSSVKKKLFIVESPAKAKTIEGYLGAEFTVEACYGHIRDLPEKRLGVFVRDHFKPEFIVPQKKFKIVTKLKKIAKNVQEIYLAGDADREGEAICQELKDVLENKNIRFYRVRFREITKTAILASIENREEIDKNLVQSQITRRILDRLVGYMISPILWKKIGSGLSAGRVQSVVLSWICKRELEIQNFIPENYFVLHALVETENGKNLKIELKKIGNEKAFLRSKESLENVLKDFDTDKNGKRKFQKKNIQLSVVEVKQRVKVKKPPKPFNTPALQQSAFQILKFGTKKTMRIAQELYEGLSLGEKGKSGLITYLRTDSTSVNLASQKSRKKFIEHTYNEKYLSPAENLSQKKNFAHEAIRPVDIFITPTSVQKFLNKDQYSLYKLIWERFTASGMASESTANTTVIFQYQNYFFQLSVNKVLFEGFTKVYPYGKTRESEDFESVYFQKSDKVDFLRMEISENMTEPPQRYTESTIVRKMEKSGIGRPSTYATILEILGKRKYIESKLKFFHPTSLGIAVDCEMNDYFEEFTNEKFTSEMESRLDKIESGELQSLDFLHEFYSPFSKKVQHATGHTRQKPAVNSNQTKSLGNCPMCKIGEIQKKLTKKGKLFYACDRFPQCEFVSYDLPK